MNPEQDKDDDMVRERIDAVKEASRFFSKAGKPGKERIEKEQRPVACFLSHLQIPFDTTELAVEPGEPVDVAFRGARFQNKEILDEGRRRNDEYREAAQRAELAETTRDLLEFCTPINMCVAQATDYAIAEVTRLNQEKKYAPAECMCLDLLFYFNLQNVYIIDDMVPEEAMRSAELRKWRSVSVFSGDFALVLFASESAPDFLRSAVGKIRRSPLDWPESATID